AMGARDCYAEHHRRDDEQQSRAERSGSQGRAVRRVRVQGRHTFHASQIGASNSGLNERGTAESSRQEDVRDGRQNESRDRESSGATRHKVGSDGDHAKYSQRRTEDAGPEVANQKYVSRY